MVWAEETIVVSHLLDLGFEWVHVPIRVKFQFQIQDGAYVRDSLVVDSLYNRRLLLSRYPSLDVAHLDAAIAKTVHDEILNYLQQAGFVRKGQRLFVE